MTPSRNRTHARRSVGLTTIALALAAGPFVVARGLPRTSEPPGLAAPTTSAPSSVATVSPQPAVPLIARTRPRPSRPADTPPDDAEPLGAHKERSDVQPETEEEFYERFLATLRADDDARRGLDARAPDVLRSPRGSARKVALLRALRDAGSPALPGMLELALCELPDVSGPHGVSVPAFVVSQLGRAERLTSVERAILERAVHTSAGGLAPNTRGRALRVLVDSANAAERLALSTVIETESHSLVQAMGEQALRSSRTRNGCDRE